MKKNYEIFSSIRGTRYDIKLTKEVKSIPGFAPEFRTHDVATVCVKYHDGAPPFLQFFSEPPNLTIEEVHEILHLLNTGFVKEDFEKCNNY